MENRTQKITAAQNRRVSFDVIPGHFATSNSHLNTYIDMSTVKTRHNNAREAAKELSNEYMSNTFVNTIVCLDGMEVVGAFMAETLEEPGNISVNRGKNISIVVPEQNQFGQMMFRDNTRRMVGGQNVLILVGSINTGKTMLRAMDTVLYYGGNVTGVCALFSAVSRVAGMDICAAFTTKDIPEYQVYPSQDCPWCKAGEKVDAIVNSYGYSVV